MHLTTQQKYWIGVIAEGVAIYAAIKLAIMLRVLLWQ